MFANFKSLVRSAAPGSSSVANNQFPDPRSPDLSSRAASGISPEEPPLVSVTSDLPEYGGSPSPRPQERRAAPHHTPTQPAPAAAWPKSATATPGRSRIEVVLDVSPYRPLPGQRLWRDADLDDPEEQLASSKVHRSPSRKKRKLTPSDHHPTPTTASSHPHAQNPITPSAPATDKRPRGRPKGWRPGMPSYKTGKLSASAARYLDEHGNLVPRAPKSASGPAKRRGRPPRAPPRTARQVWEHMAAPTYVPFLCEWVGCKAELQNADTLRRHVHKVHGPGKESAGVACRWGKCGRQQQSGEKTVLMVPEFYEHVETRHLIPLVWHVGDGVRNEVCFRGAQTTVEADQIPSYLLGPDGEQVTPWVNHQAEEDHIARMRNRNKLRDILIQRNANAPSAEEDEDMDGSSPPPPV